MAKGVANDPTQGSMQPNANANRIPKYLMTLFGLIADDWPLGSLSAFLSMPTQRADPRDSVDVSDLNS